MATDLAKVHRGTLVAFVSHNDGQACDKETEFSQDHLALVMAEDVLTWFNFPGRCMRDQIVSSFGRRVSRNAGYCSTMARTNKITCIAVDVELPGPPVAVGVAVLSKVSNSISVCKTFSATTCGNFIAHSWIAWTNMVR